MTEDELKNRISMVLVNPVLKQGDRVVNGGNRNK